MTGIAPAKATRIPDDIARAVVLPESYADERNVTFPAMKWLRANNPLGVAYVEGFDPLHLVTRYNDVVAIERQSEVFVVGDKNVVLNSQAGDEFIRGMTGGNANGLPILPSLDPPVHPVMRRLANPWFRPGNVKRFTEQLRALAKREVDRLFAEHTGGECDFAQDLGLLYPLRVIMALLGLPPEDEPFILKMTQETFGANDPENQRGATASPEAAAQTWMAAAFEVATYFQAKIVEARADPTEDLLSILANSTVDGEPLGDQYAIGQFIGIAAAGHDTTAATLSGAILALIENPDQFELVQRDPGLVERLVEEAIRYITPVKHFMRTTARDAEISGVRIAQGERLMLCFPSASHDEEIFGPDADRFDFTVERPKHASFGFGPHQCQGMMIARLELRIMFEELLPRLKSIELAGTPRFTATNFAGGIKSLPVRFDGA